MTNILSTWDNAERIADILRSKGRDDEADKIMQDIRLMEAGASAMRRLERIIEEAD